MRTKEQSSKCCPPHQAGNDNEAESSAKACFRITEASKSSPVRGMTKEPSDAETCLHVSISEASKSSPVRRMTIAFKP